MKTLPESCGQRRSVEFGNPERINLASFGVGNTTSIFKPKLLKSIAFEQCPLILNFCQLHFKTQNVYLNFNTPR